MALSVWADGPDAHGIVCSDARLRDHEGFHPFGAPVTTHDQVYGQAGWDVGVVFTSLHDLADKLVRLRVPDFLPGAGRTIRHGELTRLAIVCHGAPGELFINGLNHQRESLTPERIYGRPHQPDLQRIGLLTPNDGTGVIYFMSCNAGQGTAGTNLLVALSRAFPNRRVVAFATPGYQPAGRMLRTGEGCSEPGERDADNLNESRLEASWTNLSRLPWASETSPHAKVALNGGIIRGNLW